MQHLFPAETSSLQDAPLGDLVMFIHRGESRYGVICHSPASQSAHKSIIELAPERSRQTYTLESPRVLHLESARIELVPTPKTVLYGDVPGDDARYLGIDHRTIIAPYQDLHGIYKFADISTGAILNDFLPRDLLWFKHWRIVVDDGRQHKVLYDSLTSTAKRRN